MRNDPRHRVQLPVLLLLLLATVIVSLIVMPSQRFAAGANYPVFLKLISPTDSNSSKPGDTITMAIDGVFPSPGSQAQPSVAELVVDFNTSGFTGVSITPNVDHLALNQKVNNNVGQMTIDIANPGASFTGTVRLATMQFTLKSAGVGTISISNSKLGLVNSIDLNASNLSRILQWTNCGDGKVTGAEVCDSTGNLACTINGAAGTRQCNSTCSAFSACTATGQPPVVTPPTPPVVQVPECSGSNCDKKPAAYLPQVSGDYDGDGRTDVAIYDSYNGQWFIKPSNGSALISNRFGWLSALPIGGSNFDGDNKDDLTIYDTNTGHWYIRPSGGGADRDIIFGWKGVVPVGGGDYDGDSITDLAIFDPSSGRWYIRRSSGGDISIPFGWSSATPLPGGNFDNDNKTDLAIYDRNTGFWYIRPSAGGSDIFYAFGWTTAKPSAAGDYDGDGRTDLAIFEPSWGHWYIRRSSGGVDLDIAFGWSSVIPLSGGKYDSDNKTDLTMYDTDSGIWYIRPSLGGADLVQKFGWKSAIPL